MYYCSIYVTRRKSKQCKYQYPRSRSASIQLYFDGLVMVKKFLLQAVSTAGEEKFHL